MRGRDQPQTTMLTLVNPEQRVPANHPIRLIKSLAEIALKELSPLFTQMYSEVGRPSIPPERLLKASLLMALYTVHSERMFCEQLDYNLLFRWFLDLNWDEPSFDHSTFSRNRARLLEHDVAGEFFRTVVAEARALKLISDEHFTGFALLPSKCSQFSPFQVTPVIFAEDRPSCDLPVPAVFVRWWLKRSQSSINCSS